jgi:hypothetical protein
VFDKAPASGNLLNDLRQRMRSHRVLERSIFLGSRLWAACDQATGKVGVDVRFVVLERSCACRRYGTWRYKDAEMRCDESKWGVYGMVLLGSEAARAVKIKSGKNHGDVVSVVETEIKAPQINFQLMRLSIDWPS